MSKRLHKMYSSYSTETTYVRNTSDPNSKISMVAFSKIHITSYNMLYDQLKSAKSEDDFKWLNASIIIMAVSSIEARINEVLSYEILLDRDKEFPELGDLKKRERDLDVKSKWNELAKILARKEWNSGKEPYQSYMHIKSLRNEIVHFKANFMPINKAPNEKITFIIDKLNFKNKKSSKVQNSANWVDSILCKKDLGIWVVDIMTDLQREIEDNFTTPQIR